jgi:hypothetical protein
MISTPRPVACVLGGLALLCAACGGHGSYELNWTLGCKGAPDASCQIRSALDCSRHGLDTVLVVAVQGSDQTRAVFPCYSITDGPKGQGPGLAGGLTTLDVSGLTAAGQTIAGPVSVQITIPTSGFVAAEANLPIPPACNDGVDNDGDGLVDLQDPDCKDASGTSE